MVKITVKDNGRFHYIDCYKYAGCAECEGSYRFENGKIWFFCDTLPKEQRITAFAMSGDTIIATTTDHGIRLNKHKLSLSK